MYTNATPRALRQRYGDVLARKIMLTIGFSNMLSRSVNGCRVPLETTDKTGNRTVPFLKSSLRVFCETGEQKGAQ